MKRKAFNLYGSEHRPLVKHINTSFVPNHSYDYDSSFCCDFAVLRFVVDALYNDLLK